VSTISFAQPHNDDGLPEQVGCFLLWTRRNFFSFYVELNTSVTPRHLWQQWAESKKKE
jgi:hypothetical protein